LTLAEPWEQTGPSAFLIPGEGQYPYLLNVWRGDENGVIAISCIPAGLWEPCGEIRGTTLDELADVVPSYGWDEGMLDGEPSIVTRIQTYEPPARGGQEVVYIVAIHDGRPYIMRIWTSRNEIEGLDALIARFHFVD
jgi:hypothetical protein